MPAARHAIRLFTPFLALALLRPSHAAGQADPLLLEGLIVTASPTARSEDAVANHVTVLSGERLERLGSRSLGEVLRDVPGVDVVRGGSFGAVTSVYLRGGESDHTLVLVDGVQVNQAGGGFDFADLTTDNVERVEIVRGPASALYGTDAVAGVIHVITKTGLGAPSGMVSFEGGSYGRSDWAANLRAGADRAGYSLSLARRYTDGILDLNNASVNTIVGGNARLRPDDATSVSLTVRLTDRTYHFPTDGSGAVVDQNAFTFTDATTARLGVTRSLSHLISVEAFVALNETDGGTDDARDSAADTLGFYGFTSLDHFRRATADLRTHLRLDRTVLTVGFEYEEERQRSFSESLSEFGPTSGTSRSDRLNLAYFVHASGTASTLAFNVGGRLEDNERFGRIASWQAGATWRPVSRAGTLLRASAGLAIKEPTFFENFATGFATGNPNLDVESSRSWEVGLEQPLLGGGVTFGATYFDQALDDLIQYTSSPPGPGDPNYFNVAEAASRGVELDLDGRLGGLHGGASWTWLDTEVVDSGFDEGEGATFVEGGRLLRRPTHSAAVRLGVTLERVSVTAAATNVGGRADRDFSTFPASPVELPSYTLLSLGARWRVRDAGPGRPGFTLEVRSENLLDASYEEVVGFVAPGRAFYVGGRVEIGGP
jgi:vitamin B12 transporter